MEGQLKKRGATMPVMHDRYCVASWEIDQAFNKYVLLRSFKSHKSFLKHPTKPLSSCTLKCFGDWDGKGTFRRYEHAFVMETREGRVFLCAAPNALEKTRWLEFMSNRNASRAPPSRGNSSSELRQLMRPSSSNTLNGGVTGGGTTGTTGLSLNHRLSLQFLKESENQGGSLSVDGISDDGQYGGDLHSDTYSEYSPDEYPGCESPKSELGTEGEAVDKTEIKPARDEEDEVVVAGTTKEESVVIASKSKVEDDSVERPEDEPSCESTAEKKLRTVTSSDPVEVIEAVQPSSEAVEVEEIQGAKPISTTTPVEIPTTTWNADAKKDEHVETPVIHAPAPIVDAESEEQSLVRVNSEPEPAVAVVECAEEIITTTGVDDQKVKVKEIHDDVALRTVSELEPEEKSKPMAVEMMPFEPLIPMMIAAVQKVQPVATTEETVASVESFIEVTPVVPEPALPLTMAPAPLTAALTVKIPDLLDERSSVEADVASSTPKKTPGAAPLSSPVPSDDDSSTSGEENACWSPPQRVRSYSTSLTPLDASSTPTQRLRRYSFGSALAPVRASHVFAAMGSPIKPSFMEPHLGYVQSGLSTMVPSFPELLTSLSRQQSLEVQSEEDEDEDAQETAAVSGGAASDIVEV